jgi:hypothetical protein
MSRKISSFFTSGASKAAASATPVAASATPAAASASTSSKFGLPQAKRQKSESAAPSSVLEKAPASKAPSQTKAAVEAFPPLRNGELLYSTKQTSASKRSWLAFLPPKCTMTRDSSLTYCSTDGSSTGWHGAVVVAADSGNAILRARWVDCLGSKNVGAEAHAFALGVESLPEEGVFLADFLNAVGWDVGAAKYQHPAIISAFGLVRKHRSKPDVKDTKSWAHVHHSGHRLDSASCWFTVLNCVADNLCHLKTDVNVVVPIDLLYKLAAAQGKTAASVCQALIDSEKLGGEEKEEEGKVVEKKAKEEEEEGQPA